MSNMATLYARVSRTCWECLYNGVLTANCQGPREISIRQKSAVPVLYGPNSECLKSTWYGQTGNDQQKCSIHMTRDYNGHRLRRRAWDRGFSIKGLH